jgi:signal transduction histidine kinase
VRLRSKLLLVVLASTAAALLLAGAALFAWDRIRLRRELLGDLEATAALLADQSTAALAFQDPEAARENLRSLRSQRQVVSGCLYTADGALFAEYHRRGTAGTCPPRSEAAGADVGTAAELWAPVMLDGQPTGILFLRSDLGALHRRQLLQLAALAGALVVALGGGLLVSLRLQRTISGPVAELAATAAAVTGTRDFTLRASRRSDDEVGELVIAFNQMMGEIEEANADLRTEIHERQRAEQEKAELLTREQAARAESEAANRLKDEFLATLSHELRTPLNAILGWVALLQAGKRDDDTLDRATEVIERNARAQARLVEDLLDVSRIITGKLSLDLAPVDVAAILEAVVDTLRPAAQAKRLRLELEVEPDLPDLQADAARLQQAVWNLVSNAVKFTSEEGRIRVRCRRLAGAVEIEVADDGIGIDPAFLPLVFERFRQQDASTTRSHGGLGLGLAIVRHLVELHGGTVEAESAGAGQGATFRLRLPVSAPAAAGETAAAGGDGVRLDGLRVLLVEDETDARELYQLILEERGATVVATATVEEALRRFTADPPDVLVSDIGLPVRDGYALIRRVRKLAPAAGGKVPAVALTAYADPAHHRRALAAGFQVHAAKPVAADELAALVRRLAG